MSKQWKRYVFEKQFVIELIDSESEEIESDRDRRHNSLDKLIAVENHRRQLNFLVFLSLLKKCPNIKKVNIDIAIDCDVLVLIGIYFPHIKSLGYRSINDSLSGNNILSFFRKYGHKLEELNVTEPDEALNEYLKYCPNLKTVSLIDTIRIEHEEKEFLPKLEKIKSFVTLTRFSDYHTRMKILNNKYNKTMKTLKFRLYLENYALMYCIDCISQFENLTQLSLEFGSPLFPKPIDDCLSLIGQKCTKLLKLDIIIGESIPISDRFFQFCELKAIKELKLWFGISKSMRALKRSNTANNSKIWTFIGPN